MPCTLDLHGGRFKRRWKDLRITRATMVICCIQSWIVSVVSGSSDSIRSHALKALSDKVHENRRYIWMLHMVFCGWNVSLRLPFLRRFVHQFCSNNLAPKRPQQDVFFSSFCAVCKQGSFHVLNVRYKNIPVAFLQAVFAFLHLFVEYSVAFFGSTSIIPSLNAWECQ